MRMGKNGLLRRAAGAGGLGMLALALALATSLYGGEAVSVAEFEKARVAAIEVRVVPDRAGWVYELGAPARFRVNVIADGQPLSGVPIRYSMGRENQPATEKTATLTGEDLDLDGGTMTEPGFLRCVVKAQVGARHYRGLATVGFAPEKIMPTQVDPADFDAFWAKGKAELARVPLDPRIELIPEASRGAINVYHVSFRNWSRTDSDRYPGRIYGILCEPKAAGHYPAFLRVPASGVRPYGGERALAERGAITLEIGIHGIPVNQPGEIYDQLRTGSLDGYPLFNLDNPERYFYRRVHLGCVRALDFLTSRENWDGKKLLVFGASQGGMLAIATGALDPRVTAVAAMIPAYCDVTGYLHGRAGGWPHMFRSAEPWQRTPEKIATSSYYDTVNFAKRLRGPVLVALGFNDGNCPATSVYSAYNSIRAPKEMVTALEAGHTVTPEMDQRVKSWLAQQAGLAE
jgi:cephalosporin-C deacetylase-like acetyl esterase